MSQLYPELKVVGCESGSKKSRLAKKKNTRSPKWNTCETPCHHAEFHWRGTHCNRDRRDDCPTCVTPSEPRRKTDEDIF